MIRELVTPEARLLLQLAGERPEPSTIAATIASDGFDWNRLLWLTEREKAIAALWPALQVLPPDTVPTQALAQIGRMARVTEFRMMRLEQLLARALARLADDNIDAVLLKGAGLAVTVYGSFTARPMYDVDLLVRREHAPRAWNALRRDGWVHDVEECPPEFYESHYHLPPLDDPMGTGLALELHTAPTDGAVTLATADLWRDARAVDIRGSRALVPSPAFQLLHLCAHFAWTHGIASASWRTFRDLHKLTRSGEIDWDDLIRNARSARATTSCYWTFRLAGALAGVEVPERVMEQLRPPRPEWVLGIVERHYAAGLFAFGHASCPSVRMTQLLWSAGMAPRWSGHGTDRPWHRGEVWNVARGGGARAPLPQRLRGQASRAAQWGRYAAALLTPRTHLDRQLRSI